jgi:hypothetical protein
VCRADLERIKTAVVPFGLLYQYVEDVDMLVQTGAPSTRRAIHLMPVTELGSYRAINGIRLATLSDLVCMKLTTFRIKDKMHLKDLDEAGLITPEVEAGLSPVLAERLSRVRASG